MREAGSFDKSVPAQREAFFRLFAESHFLCMPMRAEDFGCVFAEAAAFGVPSLTTAIGGMTTTIGEAGLLSPFHTRPQEIAGAATALLAAPETYRALARRARARFEAHLNWDTATRHVAELLAAL